MRWWLVLLLCLSGCALDRGHKLPGDRIDNSAGAAGSGSSAGSGHAANGGSSGGTAGNGVGSAGMGGGAGTPAVDLCGGCDDGVFCNGTEHCVPGDAQADGRGCVSTPACVAGQTCNESSAACDTQCALGDDADFDGHKAAACGGDDCNDASALSNPDGFELCDGLDNDCDGAADDGFAQFSCLGSNSVASCITGQCVILSCSKGYADCNLVASDGCELTLDPVQGDCRSTDCAGAVIPKDADSADDGNECTYESCKDGMPVSTHAPDGTSCMDTGSCANGKCKQPE